jgi:hypothetical protein
VKTASFKTHANLRLIFIFPNFFEKNYFFFCVLLSVY